MTEIALSTCIILLLIIMLKLGEVADRLSNVEEALQMEGDGPDPGNAIPDEEAEYSENVVALRRQVR